LQRKLRKTALALATALSLVVLAGCASESNPKPKPLDFSQVPQTFAVIGDYGVGNKNEASVAKMVNSFSPDLTLSVGDNRYQIDLKIF